MQANVLFGQSATAGCQEPDVGTSIIS